MKMGEASWLLRGAALLCAGLLSGCTISDSLRHDDIRSVWSSVDNSPEHPEVIFVTDRQADDSKYGYGLRWDSAPHCGTARLTIPSAAVAGAAERADTQPLLPLSCGGSVEMAGLARAVADSAHAANCRSVLVIVHGYNTTFRSALLRAGQVAADTRWRCPVLLVSWSSAGKFDGYVTDVERSGYAVPMLLAVLRSLDAAGIRVNLYAESMGARIAMSAAAARCSERTVSFADEIILAAPDVGAELGNDDFDHLLKHSAACVRRVTIYASDNDMALIASESIHGGIPRAGRMPERDMQYTAQGYGNSVEVVDTSMAPGDPLGHGYFVLSYEMMADASWVLAGSPATQRAAADLPGGVTLICLGATDASCSGGRFALAVSKAREPDWTSRLLRHIWPLFFSIQ